MADDKAETLLHRAASYRDRMIAALEPVCVLLDEAKANGFTIRFDVGDNANGKATIKEVKISAEL